MEPILEETSLVPCLTRHPSLRIEELARTIQAFDSIGARRVLRSVRDAADRDLGEGRGLRSWCGDRSTTRDAGLFVVNRLSKQPYIDGPDGLFAAVEGQRAVEARIDRTEVLGAGLAALTDGVLVILASQARPAAERLTVDLTFLDDDGEYFESVQVETFATSGEVQGKRDSLARRLDHSLLKGATLVERIAEVFPRLRLGDRARNQIAALGGSEPVFPQLIRHLRALDEGALRWKESAPFEPIAVTFSVESKSTLQDGTLGPLRDFPTPTGFAVERWSLHTKLTGGAGARLYFRPVRTGSGPVVLVGYFGAHLPTIKFRT